LHSKQCQYNKYIMESSEQYYSRTWELASLAYKEQDFYKWCIDQIKVGNHVLEIGTGIGIATLDLLEAGFVVSSLEENTYNFEKAKERLSEVGLSINYLQSLDNAKQTFGKNNLIKTNFITEWEKVLNVIKYDTVVCWFVGVHQRAHMNPDLIELGYNERNFEDYRELIYIRIFQAISLRLPVGGIISLIERIGVLTPDQIAEELEWFSNNYELEKYGLKLEEIVQLPIGDINLLPGIKMTAVKEGGVVSDQQETNATLTCYTIVRYKDANLP